MGPRTASARKAWSILCLGAVVALLPSRARTADMIGVTTVAPASVPAGVATNLSVTARIDDPTLTAGSVRIERIDAADRLISSVGPLVDDGTNGDAVARDKIFTGRITVFEVGPSAVRLRVSAAFQGKPTRAVSSVLVVKVTGAVTIRAASGTDQSAPASAALPQPLVAVVTGEAGQSVVGLPVIFTVKKGGGLFGGQPTLTVTSDSEGRATAILTLGAQDGPDGQVVEATFNGNQSAPVVFVASVLAPGTPADTRISGVVQDKDDQPIPGVTLRLLRTGQAGAAAESAAPAVVSDAKGQFMIPRAPVGKFTLQADGTTAPNGPWQATEFGVTTVAGRNNEVGPPIRLPALNAPNRLCVDATTGGTLTSPDLPGFTLTVPPGSATFPGGSRSGCVTVSSVVSRRGPIPRDTERPSRVIVTVEPVGTVFDPPAAMAVPNVANLPPRSATAVFSYDHAMTSSAAVGRGTVSDDGQVIRTELALAASASAVNVQPPPQRLDENCIVSVLNRNTRVKPDGSWVLPNIPANFGLVRARATCIFNGVTVSGESAPFTVNPNGSTNVPPIVLGPTTPIPTSVVVTSPVATLTSIGATSQLTVTATYADGSTRNVSAATTGTTYVISNSALASITGDGLVQALQSGTVFIQATQEGASGFRSIQVVMSGDTDADGIPDDVELSLGLNPNNAADALEDPDHDNLSNVEEYRRGTNARVADTDGDGLTDGDEVQRGTSPVLVDSDGDGVSDGLEIATGSDPLNPANVNLALALDSIQVAPDGFTIIVNSVVGVAYTQLRVTGNLHDGRTIDLTSTTRGTNYASSDLNVCNFGAPDGRVFGGSAGSCTITVTNSGFTGSVTGAVTNFQPVSLSSIAIPGYANNVDVNGNFAYVAAGSTGLQVVDVTNPSAPVIVASVNTPGNANDVRVVGNTVYVADGSAGLQIIDVTNPLAPAIIGTLDTSGDASDVFISGTLAYVADGTSGIQIISVTNPRAPLLVRTVDTPGTARGIAVNGGIAVVADDAPAALKVINVSNPSAAALVGSVALGGEAIDVDIAGTTAYVADYTGGMQVIDVFNPATPVVVGSLPGSAPTGFVPRDVQVAGQFAIFAEQLFANAVAPIVDVSNPAVPLLRGVVDFGQDFAGTGVAVSGPYVYWTGQSFVVSSENGSSGTTRLFIGQYIAQEDRAGVPPTVTIDAPVSGIQIIEGTPLTVRVTATDDVAVSAVTFLVNGQAAFTDTSQPYEYTLNVPNGINALTLGARATDPGANVGTATPVTIAVVPDPGTTVTGRVVDVANAPVAGVTVTAFTRSGVTGADGTFLLADVPTAQGPIVVNATLQQGADLLSGGSVPTTPVASGTTDVGTITIVAASFETNFGSFVTSADDTFSQFTLPFTFNFYGVNYTTAFVGTNGYITFNSGDTTFTETLSAFSNRPRVAAFFDDLFGRSTGGMYVNTQLPGRFVVTQSTVPHFSAGGSNTLQITLYQDGRILFAYRGITSTTTGTITGLTPGPNTPLDQVDFSQNTSFVVAPGSSVLEYFTAANPFDLANKAIMFTPLPNGGYSVRTFALPPPAPAPASPDAVAGSLSNTSIRKN